MSKPTHEKLFLGDIEVPAGRRSLNEATVRDIADSMRAVGQLQPITVIDTGESYRLISGAHRVAAARLIADAIPFAEWEGGACEPGRSAATELIGLSSGLNAGRGFCGLKVK